MINFIAQWKQRREFYFALRELLAAIVSERIAQDGSPISLEQHINDSAFVFRAAGRNGPRIILLYMQLMAGFLKIAVADSVAKIATLQADEEIERMRLRDLMGAPSSPIESDLDRARKELNEASEATEQLRSARLVSGSNSAVLSGDAASKAALCREYNRQILNNILCELIWTVAAVAIVALDSAANVFFLWESEKLADSYDSLIDVLVHPTNAQFTTGFFAVIIGTSVTLLITIIVHWTLKASTTALKDIPVNEPSSKAATIIQFFTQSKSFCVATILFIIAAYASLNLTEMRLPQDSIPSIRITSNTSSESVVIALGIFGISLASALFYRRGADYRFNRKALSTLANETHISLAEREGVAIHFVQVAEEKLREALHARNEAEQHLRRVMWQTRYSLWKVRYTRTIATIHRAWILRQILNQFKRTLWKLSDELVKITHDPNQKMPDIPSLSDPALETTNMQFQKENQSSPRKVIASEVSLSLIITVLLTTGCSYKSSQTAEHRKPTVRIFYVDITPSANRSDAFGTTQHHVELVRDKAVDAASVSTPGSIDELYITDSPGLPRLIASFHHDTGWRKRDKEQSINQFKKTISSYVANNFVTNPSDPKFGSYKVADWYFKGTTPIIEDCAYLLRRAGQLQEKVGGPAELYVLSDGQQCSNLCHESDLLTTNADKRQRALRKIIDEEPIRNSRDVQVKFELTQARKEDGPDNHQQMIAFYDDLGKLWGIPGFKTGEFTPL